MSDSSLNVLMIAHHRRLKIGGRSLPMAKALVARGHQVTLMAISNNRRFGTVESVDSGIRIVETPDLLWGRLRSGWDPWDLVNRIRYLNRDRTPYDLVHCFETRPVTIYPALAYLRRRARSTRSVPLITDWNDWWGRGGIIEEARPAWYRSLFGWVEAYYEEAFRTRGDGLTAISTALVERAAKLGVPRERICYLPGGVYAGAFDVPSKEACRRRVGMPEREPILAFASADSHWDLDVVMESLSIVAHKYPETKLIITGRANNEILELARAHGVEQNVQLTGWLPREDLPYYLGCADVFLLPFPDKVRNVGRWPNKVGLYMGVGRPTVSNPVGDIKPLFENNDIGLLAEWNAVDFAHKIFYLLENQDIALRLGQAARQVATQQYDWSVLITRLEDFYYRVLGETGGSG